MNHATEVGGAVVGNAGAICAQPESSPSTVNWNEGSRCRFLTFIDRSVRSASR